MICTLVFPDVIQCMQTCGSESPTEYSIECSMFLETLGVVIALEPAKRIIYHLNCPYRFHGVLFILNKSPLQTYPAAQATCDFAWANLLSSLLAPE